MTLPAVIPRVIITGSGTRGPFPFVDGATSIRVTDASQIKVVRYASADAATGSTLVLDVDYTVSGLPDAPTVTLTASQSVLSSVERLLIERQRPLTQDLNLVTGGPFSSEAVESRLDTIVSDMQNLKAKIDRALLGGWSDTSGLVLPPAEARAGKILNFDSNGLPTVVSNSSFGDFSGDVFKVDYADLLTGFLVGTDTSLTRAVAYGRQALNDGPMEGWVWDASSTARDDGQSVIMPSALGQTDAGRWVRSGVQREVWGQWAQSQGQRSAPESVDITTGTAVYSRTLEHDAFTLTVNGDGTSTVTFEGKEGQDGVRIYRPSQGNEGPAVANFAPLADGVNKVILAAAYRYFEDTGIPVLIVDVSQGSQPIEVFLDSNEFNITAIGNDGSGNLTITVDDVRFLIASPASINAAKQITVSGLTGLPTADGSFYAMATSWTFTNVRTATAPVSGTFTLHDNSGAVAASGVSYGGSGGKVAAHHLWDQILVDFPAALAIAGASRLSLLLDYQGEANAGAGAADTISTVGGISTPQGYLDKRRELKAQFRSQSWVDSKTGFVSVELLRDNNGVETREKPRNDVFLFLVDDDPMHAVASSSGYTADDGTHIDDRWGIGYHSVYQAILSVKQGGVRQPGLPYYVRSRLLPALEPGTRTTYIIPSDGSDILLTDYPKNGRSFLQGQETVVRSCRFVLPTMTTNNFDIGATFSAMAWSNTGATPMTSSTGGTLTDAYASGVSRVISQRAYTGSGASQTFRYKGTNYTDVFPMLSTYVRYTFRYQRSNTWIVEESSAAVSGGSTQGTWTPIITGSSVIGVNTYLSQIGHYSQLSSGLVFASFNVQIDFTDFNSEGDLKLGGLPVTCARSIELCPIMMAPRATSVKEPIALAMGGTTTAELLFASYAGTSIYEAIQHDDTAANTFFRGTLIYHAT